MITAPPEQRVLDLIQDLRTIIDKRLVAQPVITDLELEGIDLGPTADPWWWRGTELWVVCSSLCLDDLLDGGAGLGERTTSATSHLSIWNLPNDGQWQQVNDTTINPSEASLAHVSTESQQIGAWFIVDPGLGDTFAFDREHVSDSRMLSFGADVIWPSVPAGASTEEDIPDESDIDLPEPEPIGSLLLDIYLQTGFETFPFGEVELEVPERFAGEESTVVDVPKWLTRRLILDGDADADRLNDLIASTIAARFLSPGMETLTPFPPPHLVYEAIKTLRSRHKSESTDIVWGDSPWGPIFLRHSDAEDWAQTWFAVQRSATLGELRNRVPPGQIWWIEHSLEESSYEDPAMLDDQTRMSDLMWVFDDPDRWPWLANTQHQEYDILKEMPPYVWEILDEEEENWCPTPDGDYVLYRDGERIAEAIESVGFRCERNDQLITDALGPLA